MVPLPKGFDLAKSLNPGNKFFLENKEAYNVSCCLEKKKNGFLLVVRGFSIEVG